MAKFTIEQLYKLQNKTQKKLKKNYLEKYIIRLEKINKKLNKKTGPPVASLQTTFIYDIIQKNKKLEIEDLDYDDAPEIPKFIIEDVKEEEEEEDEDDDDDEDYIKKINNKIKDTLINDLCDDIINIILSYLDTTIYKYEKDLIYIETLKEGDIITNDCIKYFRKVIKTYDNGAYDYVELENVSKCIKHKSNFILDCNYNYYDNHIHETKIYNVNNFKKKIKTCKKTNITKRNIYYRLKKNIDYFFTMNNKKIKSYNKLSEEEKQTYINDLKNIKGCFINYECNGLCEIDGWLNLYIKPLNYGVF